MLQQGHSGACPPCCEARCGYGRKKPAARSTHPGAPLGSRHVWGDCERPSARLLCCRCGALYARAASRAVLGKGKGRCLERYTVPTHLRACPLAITTSPPKEGAPRQVRGVIGQAQSETAGAFVTGSRSGKPHRLPLPTWRINPHLHTQHKHTSGARKIHALPLRRLGQTPNPLSVATECCSASVHLAPAPAPRRNVF
jgi:hypothetical protein